MVECRNFRITLVSADNLPDIRNFGQMKVYAVVSLSGISETAMKTEADMEGETNPRWNTYIDYTVTESFLREGGLQVVVKLYCERTLGDKLVGEVRIDVKSLFDRGIRVDKAISYKVAGTGDGRLNILYSFGDVFSYSFGSDVVLAPKSSGGKKVMAVMLRGAWFLLTGDFSAWS